MTESGTTTHVFKPGPVADRCIEGLSRERAGVSCGRPAADPIHTLPVGIIEIALKLGVQRSTVDQWGQRGLLPPQDWTVGGRPAWNWPTIREWAIETGRLITIADLTVELGLPVVDVERVAQFAGAFDVHDPRTGRIPQPWTGQGLAAVFTREQADQLVVSWHGAPTSYPDGTLPTERMPGSRL